MFQRLWRTSSALVNAQGSRQQLSWVHYVSWDLFSVSWQRGSCSVHTWSICLMSLGLEADGLLDSQGQGWWPSHRATCHSLTDCHKEGGNGLFLPCATSRGGVRNVSGAGVVGESISSQLAFWKRNDLIAKPAFSFMGRQDSGGLGERPTEGPGLCLGQGCPVPSTSCPALGTAEPFGSSCSSESSTL